MITGGGLTWTPGGVLETTSRPELAGRALRRARRRQRRDKCLVMFYAVALVLPLLVISRANRAARAQSRTAVSGPSRFKGLPIHSISARDSSANYPPRRSMKRWAVHAAKTTTPTLPVLTDQGCGVPAAGPHAPPVQHRQPNSCTGVLRTADRAELQSYDIPANAADKAVGTACARPPGRQHAQVVWPSTGAGGPHS